MKKVNLRNFSVTALLLLLASTNLWSIDYPLKKDDTGPGTVSLLVPKSSSPSMSRRVKEVIPVSMDVDGQELGIFFDYAVGGALITIEDVNGVVVFSTVVDTTSEKDFYFPIDELESGEYTLRIKYGSTKLIGGFDL
jgi:hypothetical protein